jgi:hypothetical protein
MNEILLFILVIAGVITLSATVWFAVKSRHAKRAEFSSLSPRDQQQINKQLLENGVSDVLTLLQKASEQLRTRQQRIESELARIEQLRGERDAVALQTAALDRAMKAFAITPAMSAGVSHQLEPFILETHGNGGAKPSLDAGLPVNS